MLGQEGSVKVRVMHVHVIKAAWRGAARDCGPGQGLQIGIELSACWSRTSQTSEVCNFFSARGVCVVK